MTCDMAPKGHIKCVSFFDSPGKYFTSVQFGCSNKYVLDLLLNDPSFNRSNIDVEE